MHPSHKISPHKTLSKEGFRGNQCLKCGWSNTPPLDIGLDFECRVSDEQYERNETERKKKFINRWGY